MKSYDHKKIEKKWQKEWEKNKIYQASDKSKKPKYYSLVEFPYPSGDGLHVGHPRPYIGMDIISRKRRMEGYNVLYPIGWDAFGLPTENYAIKTGKDPRVVTKENSDNFRRQIKSLGISFDWSREVNTTDPKYYKWTQWIFLQFLKKDLAYKAKMTINWCPTDKTGLANEEVVDGKCERCGTPVEKREKEQWMLAITKYADRLYKDLDTVDYLPQVKLAQRNWIGRSEGAEIDFKVNKGGEIKIFTTRPDTIFGATYIVLAPEHSLVKNLEPSISNIEDVRKYQNQVKNKTDIERAAESKEKTGVELKGVKAINPANKEEIPIWMADYVLPHYGTGAIMAVPAHDERDFEFAKKYNLSIKQVIEPVLSDKVNPPREGKETIHRKVVHVLVRNNKNEVLLLFWKGKEWGSRMPVTYIVGGVEEGEDIIEAARREVLEETGYKNLKYNQTVLHTTRAHFFAAHKNVNRTADVTCIVFYLENEERAQVNDKELEIHDARWISEKEIPKLVNIDDDLFFWEQVQNPAPFIGGGVLINSGNFSGKNSEEVKKEIIKFVGGKEKITFKLRDWVFSRQRYWGEPIPVIFCDSCGTVPVPEKDLPVELPKVKNYQPTDTGESPLANIDKWVNTKCPKCKGPAKRETDTMPNWAGSSWYFLRYTDPKGTKSFADPKKLKYFMPVDWYNGGNEHTTLHLLYSRFWNKFLFDQGLVPTSEPYMKRTSHGIILAEGGEKMSKSRGNVINPDTIVERFGADTLRLYEMFMGPFDQAIAWSEEAIIGPRRFLEKVWKIGEKVLSQKNSSALLHPSDGTFRVQNSSVSKLLNKTIKKVTEDIEDMHFNTAISSMMILATEMEKAENVGAEDYKKFLQILAPFAPYIVEEIWKELGEKKSINISEWPKWDPLLIVDDEVKIMIQVNGKLRGEIITKADLGEEEIKKLALEHKDVARLVALDQIKKVIYVKGRLINIVI
jgi:leucyl-tRNA synthetase